MTVTMASLPPQVLLDNYFLFARNFYFRADLWSYAAKVAVEFSVEQNNYQCDDSPGNWPGNYVGPATDCLRNKGESDCKVNGQVSV